MTTAATTSFVSPTWIRGQGQGQGQGQSQSQSQSQSQIWHESPSQNPNFWSVW